MARRGGSFVASWSDAGGLVLLAQGVDKDERRFRHGGSDSVCGVVFYGEAIGSTRSDQFLLFVRRCLYHRDFVGDYLHRLVDDSCGFCGLGYYSQTIPCCDAVMVAVSQHDDG